MKELNRSILEPYEIEERRPDSIVGVQFGDAPALLGTVDRYLDDRGVGLAVVQTDAHGHAAALEKQEGLYTAFTRAEEADANTVDEHVVQCVLHAYDPETDDEAIKALAVTETLRFAIVYTDPSDGAAQYTRQAALLARFLIERAANALDPLYLLVFGESAQCAAEMKTELSRIAANWGAAGFDAYLDTCAPVACMVDTLSARADAEEALRLCRIMNYKDTMIHLCDAHARVVIGAGPRFMSEFPWDKSGTGISFTDDIAAEFERKHRVFDTGLALMASVGFFRGARTLTDCMKDEAMREWLGRTFMDEILPRLPFAQEQARELLISAYGRYSDGANSNLLEYCGRGLIGKLKRGVLPALRVYEAAEAVLPERLTAALSAAILLMSDVRRHDGAWTVIVAQDPIAIIEPEEILEAFSRLSSDMPADALAYAVLSDRELWGTDLREIDGLAEAVARNLDN